MRKEIILIIFIFFFLFLRLYHLVPSLNFGSDQGFGILEMYKLYQSKQLTLIGPSASLTTQGQYIYVSSLVYYLSLLVLLISSWNPLSLSYFIIFLQLGSFILLYRLIHEQSNITAYLFAILYTVSPVMIDYSRFSWAPNYLIPISGVILMLILNLAKNKKPVTFLPFFIGFFFGVGLLFHYSFLLVAPVIFISLIKLRKFNLFNLGTVSAGFLAGFSPIILFELRHNFHNLRTVFLILQTKGSTGDTNFPFLQPHYFLSLLPFVFYVISFLLANLYKRYKILTGVLISLYILFSLFLILPVPKSGFTMPPGWNYTGVLKMRDIILSQKKNDYNIVDVLTGDTRAYALRALLTLAGAPPNDITDYPTAQSLFLYTREPIETVIAGPLWEIDSVKPLTVSSKWHIQNGIYLYLLEKETTSPGVGIPF